MPGIERTDQSFRPHVSEVESSQPLDHQLSDASGPESSTHPGQNEPPSYEATTPTQDHAGAANAPSGAGLRPDHEELPPYQEIPPYDGQAAAPRATSLFGRIQQVRRQASSSTLGAQAASRSRISLASTATGGAGFQPQGDVPPVPPLPEGYRGAQATGVPSSGTEASAPQAQTAGATAGPGPSTRQSFLGRASKQEERNHRLRDAVTKGDLEAVERRLGKGAHPGMASSNHGHNAFHKAALSPNLTNRLVHALTTTEGRDSGYDASVGQAATIRDSDGNTPIHLARERRGQVQGQMDYLRSLPSTGPGARQRGQRLEVLGRERTRLTNLVDRLDEAAGRAYHGVRAITNNAGMTAEGLEQSARARSRQGMEQHAAVENHLRQAGL